jgi:hypothetical protein
LLISGEYVDFIAATTVALSMALLPLERTIFALTGRPSVPTVTRALAEALMPDALFDGDVVITLHR